MKKIKYYVIFEGGGNNENDEHEKEFLKAFFLHNDYLKEFNFIKDCITPDYLIVTSCIYSSKKYSDLFKKMYKSFMVTIFLADECYSPDLNIFDYAICFERFLHVDDRVIRLPTILRYRTLLYNDLKVIANSYIKTKFCNFMYSNPNGHINREKLFCKISEYKKVDSMGKFLNNMGNKTSREFNDWSRHSIIERMPYKFSIVAENGTYKGYITEKILCCLQAKTIPIYWGDSTIAKEFNPKAFINCHEYKNFDEVLDKVKEIDQSEQCWNEMVSQPWFLETQKYNIRESIKFICSFYRMIFSQNLLEAKRIPIGTTNDVYLKQLLYTENMSFILVNKYKRYYELLTKWFVLKQRNIKLDRLLPYKNIGIYGMGKIGKILCDEFYYSTAKCTIDYAIDLCNEKYKEIEVVNPNADLKRVDAIIVTIPNEFESIKKNLKSKIDCPIVLLEKLLDCAIEEEFNKE